MATGAERETERLEREILQTRMRLGEDVEALMQKFSPRRVAAREAAKARMRAKEHPEILGMAALGIGVVAVTLLIWTFRRHR